MANEASLHPLFRRRFDESSMSIETRVKQLIPQTLRDVMRATADAKEAAAELHAHARSLEPLPIDANASLSEEELAKAIDDLDTAARALVVSLLGVVSQTELLIALRQLWSGTRRDE